MQRQSGRRKVLRVSLDGVLKGDEPNALIVHLDKFLFDAEQSVRSVSPSRVPFISGRCRKHQDSMVEPLPVSYTHLTLPTSDLV